MSLSSRSSQRSVLPALSIGFLLLLLSGCGSSNIGTVKGIVTMDGTPLVDAAVAFHPTDGRASIGRTNASGEYELGYLKGEAGAIIGSHKVTIGTKIYSSEAADSEGNPMLVKGKPETMPPRYSELSKSVLTADVKSGPNQIDFALESKE